MLIGFQLLHIKRGPAGHVDLKYRASAFVKADGFQKSVCWDQGSVCCSQFFRRKQAECNILPLLIPADAKGFVLLQKLFQADLHLLALIGKADAGVRDGDFLSRVGQNHFLWLWIEHHALRRIPFQNLIAA